jgi:4-methylaminobutanoate oxidase (formaldehyde-forming)
MIEADEPITQAFLDNGQWTVNIAGNLHSATASLKPMYDPTNARIHS